MNFLGTIKRARISNEQDPRKPSPSKQTIFIQPGSRTLRPRQPNSNTPHILPPAALTNDHSPPIDLHRQSSSSSTSSNHCATSVLLRSAHVSFFPIFFFSIFLL
jgi:hypothetical protein